MASLGAHHDQLLRSPAADEDTAGLAVDRHPEARIIRFQTASPLTSSGSTSGQTSVLCSEFGFNEALFRLQASCKALVSFVPHLD